MDTQLVRVVDADAPDNAAPLLEYRPTYLPRTGDVIIVDRRPWHVCAILHEVATGIVWITVRTPLAYAQAMREHSQG